MVTQIADIEGNHTLVQIHVALMSKDVKGAGCEELQRERQLSCLELRLLQQLFTQRTECWRDPCPGCFNVNLLDAAVYYGFVLGAEFLICDLIQQRHDKLRFLCDGIPLNNITVLHLHGVDTVFAARRHIDNRANIRAQCFYQRCELLLRITDQHIIVRIENQKRHQFFCAEGFAGTGYAENKRGLIHELCSVDHDEVVADSVLPEEDTAVLQDFLHLKGNEYSQTLRGQRPKGIDAPRADGQHRIEAVRLLKTQHRELTHVLSCHSHNCISILIKLLLCLSGQYHCDNAEHHALVLAG